MIGQFSCSGLPPFDAKGKPAVENECKNISTGYNFLNSGLNHTKPGADPGWSFRGRGVEAKIGRKEANFTRFWPILEGAVPPRPPSGSATENF